jgi:acid phosphatase family membrane protein YuiD
MSGFIAWICAQLLKSIIYTSIHKRFELSRLFGDGGMPSGHSATVSAVAVTSAIYYGLASFQFAVTAVLAVIVMHDAMGVRLETGKQSKLLNQLTELIYSMGGDLSPREKLKEFVGHTPMQVYAGGILGVIIAVVLQIYYT